MSPDNGQVYSIQYYVIKLVSDLRQVSFLCCFILLFVFLFVCCVLCPIVPVSLDYPFFIALSFFSIVYLCPYNLIFDRLYLMQNKYISNSNNVIFT